jgi:hypothetical protein
LFMWVNFSMHTIKWYTQSQKNASKGWSSHNQTLNVHNKHTTTLKENLTKNKHRKLSFPGDSLCSENRVLKMKTMKIWKAFRCPYSVNFGQFPRLICLTSYLGKKRKE